jgi:2,3-bisphosphoglycerate-independent phosphoglycerate mutase
VVAGLGSDDALIVTSDHGNVEDATTRVHTRCPVPLLAWGPVAKYCEPVRSIADVMDAVVQSVKA